MTVTRPMLIVVVLAACSESIPVPDEAVPMAAPDATILVDAAAQPDLSVADLRPPAPDLIITGVVETGQIGAAATKLRDGEWVLEGVPPEGTFAVAMADDASESLWVNFVLGAPSELAHLTSSARILVTAGEAVYLWDDSTSSAWWPSLGSTMQPLAPAGGSPGSWYPAVVSSPDGKWIAYATGAGQSPWTYHVGPREGPFESLPADDWVVFAASPQRVFFGGQVAVHVVMRGSARVHPTRRSSSCHGASFASSTRRCSTCTWRRSTNDRSPTKCSPLGRASAIPTGGSPPCWAREATAT